MQQIFLKILAHLFKNAFNKIFGGSVVTLASFGGLYTIVNNLADRFVTQLNTAPELALNFLGLSGLDVGLSLMLSALLSRTLMVQAQVFLARV